MSNPTKVTITSITAESGSSTQPRSKGVVPTWIQVKFDVSRTNAPCIHPESTWAKATSESRREKTMDPMARFEASLRRGCLSNAITPDATIGTVGMSHSGPAIAEVPACGMNEIGSCINPSPLHPVNRVEIGGLRVAMNLDYQPQSHRSLSRCHRD